MHLESPSMTVPGSSKARESVPLNIIKSAKKAIRPLNKEDRSISNGVAAVHVELGKLQASSSGKTFAPTLTKQLASAPNVTVQPTLSSDIFPDNIFKLKEDIPLPKVGDRIDDTAQLVLAASLLANTPSPSSSPSQLEWARNMENFPIEKESIQRLIARMVDKFISHPSREFEAIKEIVTLAPVLSQEDYRRLLNCFLSDFGQAAILVVEILQGLIQLVEDAPLGYLQSDDMIKILRMIRARLEDPAHRESDHKPLLDILVGLKTREDPFLRYQALYAFQALQWVPDDETPIRAFLRHFTTVTGGIIKMSGVVHLNFSGLVGGANDIQETLGETIEFVKSAWEEVPDILEGGKGVFDSLKEGFISGRRHPWYIAVRGAQDLARTGQLANLNQLICESPCRQHPLFQWGICQLLAEVAIDPSWDIATRDRAVRFLKEMYLVNQNSTKHKNVRCWVLTILRTISDSSSPMGNEKIRNQCDSFIQDLDNTDGDMPFPHAYFFGDRLPFPKSYLLLKEVNNTPDLELHLHRLRHERCQEYDSTAIYIEPLSKENLQASGDNLTPLQTRVENFLASKNEVMLILGDSGAGKSTFGSRLERDLWNQYQSGGPIPLFIDLKTIDTPEKNDLVREHLTADNMFSPEQIDELKKSRQFILICDGYDECRKWWNLHTINRLNRPRQWMAKMLITCRSQYLVPDYRTYFEPQLEGNRRPLGLSGCYEEAVIVPFKMDQIKDYIDLHRQEPRAQQLFGDRTIWSTDRYLSQLTNLMDLVKNPFMLRLVLDILPSIAKDDRDLSAIKISRVQLYDEFVMQHFENEYLHLTNQRTFDKMDPDSLAAFELMGKNDFVLEGIEFSKRLALSIFESGGRLNAVEYSARDKGTWKDLFFDPESSAKVKLFRNSSQLDRRIAPQESIQRRGGLVRTKTVYSFVHRSILEYFFSCLVYDPNEDPEDVYPGSAAYHPLLVCLDSDASPSPVSDHPFGQHSLISEPSIIHFLAERADESSSFRAQLHTTIDLSKAEALVGRAAANAITILVKAGEHFNGADLRRIRIPGADLTGGFFDSANLQDANLNKVNFTQTWLREVDFSRSDMEGVIFGEKPFLESPGFRACASSPDGSMLAVGYASGDLRVYSTSNWTVLFSLDGHTDMVLSVSFSYSGRQLASGSADKTVRIWNLQQEVDCRVMQEHSAKVNCVAFSPDGTQLASASSDKTVRVWDADIGTLAFVFNASHDDVQTVAWFPDGEQLASGAKYGMLRLWSVSTRKVDRRLKVGLIDVQCISISPDGQRLVAGCKNDLHLWNFQTGADPEALVLKGHTGLVTAVAFSRNGHRIASSSLDRSVRLWDGQTGALISTWVAHSDSVHSLAFLNDREIASGTEKITRIWELDSKLGRPNTANDAFSDTGHLGIGIENAISSMAYSPDGQFVFSFSPSSREATRIVIDRGDGNYSIISTPETADPVKPELGPNDEIVLAESCDGTVMLWGVQERMLGIMGNRSNQSILQVCTDGVYVILVNNRSLVICEREDPTLQLLLDCFTSTDTRNLGDGSDILCKSSRAIVFSGCCKWITFSQFDGSVTLVDTRSGSERELAKHEGKCTAAVFSPNGHQLVTSCPGGDGENGTTFFWETLSAECTETWDSCIRVISYSPCGTMMAYAEGNVVYTWHFEEGTRTTVGEHDDKLNCIAWSSCGRWIASGSDDCNACLWKLQPKGFEPEWSRVAILRDFLRPVKCILWSPVDPSQFVTAGADRSFCVWRLVEEDNNIRVKLVCGSLPSRLAITGARISGVDGLGSIERELMLQRHAIEE
ncbi:hypothetical protein EMPS_07352 [Entomortierella parvispora]|uniref:WD40 repeat-like protein n=1 Tax=Entomortierella parvispora TaxID=205924 RepID=A0A9P3LYA2_9FUNG|nr:hypothetical protein EMPS_07352 [Entomortierella parvispora]